MTAENTIKALLCKTGVTLFLIYSFFVGLNISIFTNPISLSFWLILALFFILCATGIPSFSINKITYLSWICIAIIVFNRNYRLSNGVYKTELKICIMLLAFMFLCSTSYWHTILIPSMVFFGSFYSLSTIILYIFPQLYFNIVVPLFGGAMIRAVNKGLAAGFSAHYSTTAIYLVTTITVPISVFIKKYLNEKYSKFYLFLTILIISALLLTGKRAHTIFVLLSALVCYYVMNRKNGVGKVFKILMIAATIIVAIIIASQFIPALQNVMLRFESTIEHGDVTSGRIKLINLCFEMFKSSPLVGTGWGKFTFINPSGFVNGHCVYVQLLGENGLLLSLPFYLFFIFNYVRSIKAAKVIASDSTATKNTNIYIIYSVFIQTFFLLYCLTGNPLYDYQMFCPYILGCAVSEYYYRQYYTQVLQRKRVNK